MAKRKRGKKRGKIRAPQYKDHNISSLDDHKREGKTLLPPFQAMSKLEGVPFSPQSWLDSGIPEILWCVVLVSQIAREDYLDTFRHVAKIGRALKDRCDKIYITHSSLSKLDDESFDELMSPLLVRTDIKELLSGLLFFENLPDSAHWRRHLPEPEAEKHWQILGKAIADCFDHQFEKSTDCRWLKVLFMMVTGRLHIPEEKALEILEFPNRGDMRSVRPSIRACEIGFRQFDADEPHSWNEDFWTECWEKTHCQIREPRKPNLYLHRITTKALMDIYAEVTAHFHATLESTKVDARHDGAFGLCLYCVYLAIALSRGDIAFRGEGRLVLRSLVEAYITLKYLSFQDDHTIWNQYRNYGVGQAKLSFLKNISSENLPDYIDIEELEMHANADIWMEFQDIKLGAWDNKNLRNMAQLSDVKEIYDKYYDWPSGFVHGNWSAVRDTTFELCLNPLHRFHRVASFPRLDMNDALIDAGKLVNLSLEELNKLYPTFKPRLKKEDRPS